MSLKSIPTSRLFIWYPVALCVVGSATYLFFIADDGLPAPSGPGGGGEGIHFLMVSLLRLLTIVALVVCVFTFPRKLNLSPVGVLIVIVGWSLIFAAMALVQHFSSQTRIIVRAVDVNGQPVAGVRLDYRLSQWLPGLVFREHSGSAISDSNGMAVFRVGRFSTLTIHGDPRAHPSHELSIFNHGYKTTFQVIHSNRGVSDRNTLETHPPKNKPLDLTMRFAPTASTRESVDSRDR